MDGKVSDFFDEINRIAPTKKSTPEWKECYDESSGYSYYWDVKTNKVTWDMPANFKSKKLAKPENSPTGIPPRPAPLFPSTAASTNTQNVVAPRKSSLISNDGGEKRRILMASHGNDTDSEDDKPMRTVANVKVDSPIIEGPRLPRKVQKQTNTLYTRASDSEEEEIDLLNKIQNQAKVLTQLGGELPASVKKIIGHNGCTEPEQDKIMKQTRASVTGFSLVAGYSDTDDEEDNSTLPVVPKPENKITAPSTLFPTSKPIDVTQFNETKKDSLSSALSSVDTKVFQRKRRIGIDFMDSINKPKTENSTKCDQERLGLGFKAEKEDESTKTELKSNYAGFKSGGLMFVKPEINPVTIEPVKKNALIRPKQKIDNDRRYNAEDLKIIENSHKSVSEKLHFLAEGREVATPVQTMIIQMETLYDAMKAKSLSVDYFYKWLHNTSSELVKLEKGAAPSGWILKWDRIVKRYYYRNLQSGDCQWDYPQPDIVGGDEAMDISTTPPPPVVEEPPLPPLPEILTLEPAVQGCAPPLPPPPPRIQSTTPPPPPPPPTISKEGKRKNKTKNKRPLVKKPSSPKKNVQNLEEPLPPGVDVPPPEVQPVTQLVPMVNPVANEDALGSALTSFYSDLATMESSAVLPPLPPEVFIAPVVQNPLPLLNNEPEKVVKKKKPKVKIVEGLAMKKKGVSKLVEKWKNVQKDY